MSELGEVSIAEFFINNAQSSRITDKKNAVEKVLQSIANATILEKDVFEICNGLHYIFGNYNPKSKRYLEQLVRELIRNYPKWSVERLCLTIQKLGGHYKKIVANRSTSKCCLFAFKLSMILLEEGWDTDCLKINVSMVAEAQMYLICSLVSGGINKYVYKAAAMIFSIQKKIPSINLSYVEVMETLEPTYHLPIFGSFLCTGIANNEILLQELIALLLNIFVKTLVNVKTKPSKLYILSCYPFLKHLSSNQFNDILLPSLQKSLLRNPEVILESVGLIISGLELDLSKCAVDLSKPLITNLTSKDDLTRNESVESFKCLSRKVSDPASIQEILKQILDVFHGSSGKISVAEHKISILQAAGNLSFNNTSPANQSNISMVACEYFIKVLETEVQEKTLVAALSILLLWLIKLKPIPEKIINSLKNGINLKTSTALVRTYYIQCFLLALEEGGIGEYDKLVPLFLALFEKGLGQSNQVVAVTEALAAACAILKLITLGEGKSNNLQHFWNVLFDMEKQVFVSEKFISTASNEAMILVMKLCKVLLVEYSEKIHNKSRPIFKAVLSCLTSNALSVRKECFKILRCMLAGLTGVSIAKTLLNELSIMLEIDNHETREKNEISSHVLGLCITNICSAKNLTSEDAHKIIMEALLPAHHPIVTNALGNLWLKILNYMKINEDIFIKENFNELENIFSKNYKLNKSYENALSTVVSIGHGDFLKSIVNNVIMKLEDPRILKISKDDYFTYLTPEGEIYDKSVIPGQDESSAINMKRESKVYSFKEQQEELQLRRELQEKKRKEGKLIAPQYTPKQLEVIRNQKVKEQEIRDRLTEIRASVAQCLSQLTAVSKGNPQDFSFYLKNIIPLILKNCDSPLAAPLLTSLYLDLRHVVFPKDLESVAKTISHTTLRLLKPQCDLESCWEGEDLEIASVRILNTIYNSTKGGGENKDANNFSVFAFTYTFPFIKKCLLSDHTKNQEITMQRGLQILSEFSKIARVKVLHKNFNTNLEALPRKQMLELLFELISSTNGRIQTQAEAVLLDVASTANTSSEIYLKASEDELDVLMVALQSSIGVIRDAALRGLIAMETSIPTFQENSEQAFKLSKRIWIAKCDGDEQNRILADKVWSSVNYAFAPHFVNSLTNDLEHPVDCIQASAAESLGAYLKIPGQSSVQETVEQLIKLYKQRLTIIPSKVDEFGREIEKPIDIWQPRRGVALAFKHIAPLIEFNEVGPLIDFFVSTSLADRIDKVRKEMLNAALTIVDIHGKETVGSLLPVFENFMDKSSKSAHYDHVKQAVVILMGSLARHLDKEDQRIKPIVQRLISALSTPSQQVQESVANCLPYLVPSIKEEAPGYVNKLLHQLLKSDKYGDRKGAAYGLAGLVKGMGILALKQLDIMTKLTDAIQDKKNYKHREGALFAFEMLFQMLGKLFEPYIVHVLPHLLLCFGDSSQYVRNATDDTAKVVMSKLSGHGVKLVLPSLLAALEDDSWRTKTGSVELLGAMAYCAPKQLSSCLPSIVPKLIEVLSDSHLKVQEAGAEALKVIGSVIRNPEIQAIVPVLLNALQDPSHKTSACLQTLLDTQFVHFIDAPSLALIMPVVQRAFMDRSTETRKMAAQIIGNMYSLTDQKDLMPYLPKIIPGLKTSLLDPVPEVRSVSARALGAMVRGMGESHFEDLLPWLMQTLTSDTSSVDRSGAAQGLSEVVGGLGVEKLHKLMPEIIATAERTDIESHVKDGYIMMFIYMPVVFQKEFTPYIGQIINPILKALADEKEFVRDTALKAGQRIVTLYADSAILLLLPELERGLFDDNWRIRYSSVQLLGDLLYRISGVTGKMSTETASEDDNFGTEQSHTAIIHSLGAERRNRVLAGLYMGRSDVALMVRQAALHVWKVVVTNTPRTLREILPTLFGLLLGCLASESYDKRQVAARTLGDLVRKLGERVLPEIIPILEKGLQSEEADQRQGVCIGLSEIMASTSREMVLTFVNSLVPTVRKALCDPLPEVREAAGKTFDSLHSTVGAKALDDILPAMLNQLNDDDPDVVEWTLDGLRQVMAIKSRVVLPYLIPQLTAPPANTKALSILASVAGESLNKYLVKILPALQNALTSSRGTLEEAQQSEYCQAVILSIVDENGTRTIIDSLLESTRSDYADQRRSAAALLCAFCANSRAQYTTHIPQLYRGLIHLCTDTDKEVLQMAWEALNAVTKTLDSKQQSTYVFDIRQAVRFAVSDMKGTNVLLPGFCLPKGIAPILPIFREAILNGDGDEKEAAAQGLGEVIKLTNAAALQTSVVAITGPLIRILGDRFNPNVKTAVLETLAILLEKVGIMLKQFLPQLQTTFVKALNDPNRVVRLKAAGALSHLILIHQRPDPLFSELHNTIKNTDDLLIRETTLHALRGIITPAGDKMTESVRKQIHQTLTGLISHSEDTTRICAAGCLGALCKYLTQEQLEATLNDQILVVDNQYDWVVRHGRSAALSVALKECPEVLWVDDFNKKIQNAILNQFGSDKVQITQNAIRSFGYLLLYLISNDKPLPYNVLLPFVKTMNNTNNDVKQLLARVCIHLAKNIPTEKMAPELLKLLLPMLVNGTKEKNGYVKANSEIALIAVLRLKEGDDVNQKCLQILDAGARESLSDVVSKVLRKIMNQHEGKEEELDNTLLS